MFNPSIMLWQKKITNWKKNKNNLGLPQSSPIFFKKGDPHDSTRRVSRPIVCVKICTSPDALEKCIF